MNISPVRTNNIIFGKKRDRDQDQQKGASGEVGVVAGGVAGSGVAARVSGLNKRAINAGKVSTRVSGSLGRTVDNAKSFSEGIMLILRNLAKGLKLDKVKSLKNAGNFIMNSKLIRRVSGTLGGAIAVSTAVFELADTGVTFKKLAEQN